MSRSIKSEDLESLFGTNFQPSPDLIKAIEAKQCIAFVGAGFTAPITQLTWKSLLTQMLEEQARAQFEAKGLAQRYNVLLQKLKQDSPTAGDFLLVAQEMQDILGERVFEEFIVEKCKLKDDTSLKPEMVHRIRCLSRIPFKAIITTNYNSVFSGLERNVEPALHNGSINPCTLWESILRSSSGHDQLEDDRDDVVEGATSSLGDQDSEESMDSLNLEVKHEMTLKQALDKYVATFPHCIFVTLWQVQVPLPDSQAARVCRVSEQFRAVAHGLQAPAVRDSRSEDVHHERHGHSHCALHWLQLH